MFLVETIARDKAEGLVAQAYNAIPAQIDIPVPLQLLSASPGLMERELSVIGYFRSHPRLTPPFLASLRYVASQKFGYAPCAVFNAQLLRSQGMSEADIAALSCKPAETPLDEAEAALLAFVTRAIDAPGAVTRADITTLTGLGWQESDVLDAMSMAARMKSYTMLYQVFVRD